MSGAVLQGPSTMPQLGHCVATLCLEMTIRSTCRSAAHSLTISYYPLTSYHADQPLLVVTGDHSSSATGPPEGLPALPFLPLPLLLLLPSLCSSHVGSGHVALRESLASSPAITTGMTIPHIPATASLHIYMHTIINSNVLQSSMTYIYGDSQHWTGLYDLILYNSSQQW